jgi:ribosomal protein L16 Arg81 hydroxylase
MIPNPGGLHSPMSLSDLLRPHDEASFFADYWEQRPLHIRKGVGDVISDLLTLDTMDRLLSDLAFRVDECKVACDGQIIPASSYLAQPGMRVMERAAAEYVSVAAALNWFDQGATLVFAQLNQKWPPLQSLKEELERSLLATVLANVFLSNRNSQGFSLHYDSHDVFVLQLHGQKIWSLYDNPIELPTKSQSFGTTGVSAGALKNTVTLEPGDILYVPRGYFHEARTTDTVSLHVTLGVHPYLWVAFLGDMLTRLGSERIGLRRSVSRGFMGASQDERVALLREMANEMMNFDAFGGLAEDIYLEAIRRRLRCGPRPPRRRLADLVSGHDLMLQSPLCRHDPARLVVS